MSDFLFDIRPLDLLILQSNIRMILIQHGIEQESSLDIACEIYDNFMKNPIVKEEYAALYQSLSEKGSD